MMCTISKCDFLKTVVMLPKNESVIMTQVSQVKASANLMSGRL